MASVNYAYTSLAAEDSVVLQLKGSDSDGNAFPPIVINQFSAAFGLNQIPEATCSISVGRNAWTTTEAIINKIGDQLTSMMPATITATFTGEYKPGQKWPSTPVVMFDGYLTGMSYQKVAGRVQPVLHFIHWLVDLGFSSAISSVTHPDIASSMVSLAVMYVSSQSVGSGTDGYPAFLPELIGHDQLAADLSTDLWGALKSYLCAMSQYDGFSPIGSETSSINPGCQGADTLSALRTNNRAGNALARIEGPAGQCSAGAINNNYKYGAALNFASLEAAIPDAADSVAQTIGRTSLSDMAQKTLWDVLVGYYCPMFGLILCPAIDRAVIMPDVPGWRGNDGSYRRCITPDEYDFIEETSMIPMPLRGVVVTGSVATDGGVNQQSASTGSSPTLAGAYAVPGTSNASDGTILYVPLPGWLNQLPLTDTAGGDSNGTTDSSTINTATTAGAAAAPSSTKQSPKQLIPSTVGMLNCYAKMVYVQNALRGRSANMSGRLRLDIAPGTHLQIMGNPEQFLGSQDNLGGLRFGQVVRTTYEIDAESRRAATSFQITALRNLAENVDDRFTTAEHPLFPGSMGQGGLPLTADMDLPGSSCTNATGTLSDALAAANTGATAF